MLGDAKLESFVEVDSHSPGVLYADRIRRPGIERLWYGLAEQECGRSIDHEPPQWTSSKRTDLQNSREHIAREQAARGVYAAVLPGVAGAEIRVNLIVRRSQVELRPAPEHVSGEKHSLPRSGLVPTALRGTAWRTFRRRVTSMRADGRGNLG